MRTTANTSSATLASPLIEAKGSNRYDVPRCGDGASNKPRCCSSHAHRGRSGLPGPSRPCLLPGRAGSRRNSIHGNTNAGGRRDRDPDCPDRTLIANHHHGASSPPLPREFVDRCRDPEGELKRPAHRLGTRSIPQVPISVVTSTAPTPGRSSAPSTRRTSCTSSTTWPAGRPRWSPNSARPSSAAPGSEFTASWGSSAVSHETVSSQHRSRVDCVTERCYA
jgi:hypothetical protein